MSVRESAAQVVKWTGLLAAIIAAVGIAWRVARGDVVLVDGPSIALRHACPGEQGLSSMMIALVQREGELVRVRFVRERVRMLEGPGERFRVAFFCDGATGAPSWTRWHLVGPARDVTSDGRMDHEDVARLHAAFGHVAPAPSYDPWADLDRDGRVGISDHQLLWATLGKCSNGLTWEDCE